MSATVTPFLMFQGQTDEAVELYLYAFPGCRVAESTYRGFDGSALQGKRSYAVLVLGGLRFICADSDFERAFRFTPSLSLFVDFDTEAELRDSLSWLSQGGKVLMPLADQGPGRKFAWLNDRFGVSWQLNLP